MVEVSSKKSELRISVWKFVLFLIFMFLILALLLWSLFGTQFSASNSFLETMRRYLSFASSLRPNTKPEDNFDSVLRIHGVEKLGPKHFAMFVSVTDKNGDPVAIVEASKAKLKVKEAGKKIATTPIIDKIRPIHMYSNWNHPISFSSVMDYSGSMFPDDISAIESYYSTLINSIKLPIQAAVIKFNDLAKVVLSISSDKDEILGAIKKSIPLQNTALFDGIDKGIEEIQAKPHFRFIILTTDGNDNASMNSQADVLRRCALHNISVFVFGFGWSDPGMLKNIADKTDGLYSYVPDSSKLKDWFKRLASVINNVQVIEFSTISDMTLPKELDLKIEVGGKTLSRKKQTSP